MALTQEQTNIDAAFKTVKADVKELRKSLGVFSYQYPTLQDALNAAAALRCPVLLRPNETIVLPQSGVSADFTKTAIKGFASTLSFPFTTGSALTGTGPGGNAFSPYEQSWCGLEGIQLKCTTGVNNTAIAIDLHSTGEPGASHISFTRINVCGFATGLQVGANSYVVNATASDFFNCGDCVSVLNAGNSGERISFINCCFFNSIQLLKCRNPNADVYFSICSTDYCNAFADISDGQVWYNQGHIEYANLTGYPVKVSGTASLYLEGNRRLCTSNATMPTAWFNITTNPEKGGGVWESNSFINNCPTTSGYMADGTGNYYPDKNSSYEISQNALLTTKVQNKFLDGSFSSATILDDFIVNGTSARTDRFTAQNSKIEIATYNSKPALKYTKAFGPGSGSTFSVFVPVKAGLPVGYEYFVSKPGSSTGGMWLSFFYSAGYSVDVNGYPSCRKRVLIGTDTFNFTASPVDRRRTTCGEPVNRMPAWVTHFEIEVNSFNWNGMGDSVYFQDFCLTQ